MVKQRIEYLKLREINSFLVLGRAHFFQTPCSIFLKLNRLGLSSKFCVSFCEASQTRTICSEGEPTLKKKNEDLLMLLAQGHYFSVLFEKKLPKDEQKEIISEILSVEEVYRVEQAKNVTSLIVSFFWDKDKKILVSFKKRFGDLEIVCREEFSPGEENFILFRITPKKLLKFKSEKNRLKAKFSIFLFYEDIFLLRLRSFFPLSLLRCLKQKTRKIYFCSGNKGRFFVSKEGHVFIYDGEAPLQAESSPQRIKRLKFLKKIGYLL